MNLRRPRNSSWTTVFSTEARYFYWRNNFGAPNGTGPGRGSEFYLPFAMQLTGKSFETWNADFTVRGGWVKAIQSTPGHSGTVQTTTDTVASGTVTYLGLQGIQPFVALNANLPTGKTVLLGSQANARMDPDFVDISTFGEGFNLGPTAGFNFPITDTLLITTSLGYTWRGRFTQDSIGDLTNPFLTSRSLGRRLLASTERIRCSRAIGFFSHFKHRISGRTISGRPSSMPPSLIPIATKYCSLDFHFSQSKP